jgi:hypothetical protein
VKNTKARHSGGPFFIQCQPEKADKKKRRSNSFSDSCTTAGTQRPLCQIPTGCGKPKSKHRAHRNHLFSRQWRPVFGIVLKPAPETNATGEILRCAQDDAKKEIPLSVNLRGTSLKLTDIETVRASTTDQSNNSANATTASGPVDIRSA